MNGSGQAIALAALACSSAAVADVLVIRSTSTNYYSGQRLRDADAVQLGRGEHLLVLAGRQTRRYCGPAAFRLNQRNVAGCRPRGTDGVRVGAVSSSQIGGGRAQGLLILRATGPTARLYRPGTRIAANTRLNLRPGDAVVVLQMRGPAQFRGPGSFRASQPPPRPSRLRTAAPALASGPLISSVSPASVWHVDARAEGRLCTQPGTPLALWRPSSAQEGQVTLSIEGEEPVLLNWPAGQATLPVPERLLRDGATLTLAPAEGGTRRLDIVVMPSGAAEGAEDENDALASALIAFGCRSQLDTLISTTRRQASETTPETAPTPDD